MTTPPDSSAPSAEALANIIDAMADTDEERVEAWRCIDAYTDAAVKAERERIKGRLSAMNRNPTHAEMHSMIEGNLESPMTAPAKKALTVDELRALPLWKQKVLLAEDVIALLKAKRIRAERGAYFELLRNDDRWDEPDTIVQKIFHDAFSEDDLLCAVCGIGAVFVAAVDKFDTLTVGNCGGEPHENMMIEYMGEWFSESELRAIEVAFEGRRVPHGIAMNTNVVLRALDFGHTEQDQSIRMKPDAVMIKIMENIVANKGEFKP